MQGATRLPSGGTAKEFRMTTLTLSNAKTQTLAMPVILALIAGLGLVLAGGLASSSVLHDAAHDARHALAFPCH